MKLDQRVAIIPSRERSHLPTEAHPVLPKIWGAYRLLSERFGIFALRGLIVSPCEGKPKRVLRAEALKAIGIPTPAEIEDKI